MFKSISRKNLLASTIIVGLAFTAAPGFAQSQPLPPPPTESPPGEEAEDRDEADPREQDPSNTTMAPAEGVESTDPEGEIIVTGTLIRNPNIETSSPVSVVGEQEIEYRQSNNAEQLLREIPASVPSVGAQVNNGQGGSSFVNLRGIGAGRNIVLLNGARLTPVALGSAIDLNNIPLALVERVDVLTGGAVTTYGADAISGVVNFIIKDDFAGMELDATNQITQRGDGHTFRADLSVGANFDDGRGNAAFSVGYQNADPVFQGDRPFSIFNISGFTGDPGGSSAAVPAFIVVPAAPGFTSVVGQINEAGTDIAPGLRAPFNFNPFNIFQTPFKRFNIFGTANYDISDVVEVFATGLFSNNEVSSIIAPSASFFNTFTIPFSNPFIPNAILQRICASQGLNQAQCQAAANATGPGDPNFRTFRGQVRRRFVEGGVRSTQFVTTSFSQRVGVRAEITDSLELELFGSYGQGEQNNQTTGFGLRERLQQALLASDPDQCSNTAGGCVPFNLFGPQGSITQDMLNFVVGPALLDTEFSSQTNVRGVISGDFGFGSPWSANPLGIAVGAEYRNLRAETDSDLPSQTPGAVLGAGGADVPVSGRFNVREIFGEIVAPIVEDRPGFNSLTLEGGARLSDYSTTGRSFTWKGAGQWEPISSLKLRGSYNRATRSPNIGELFFPQSVGLGNLTVDPCAGNAPLQNANLRAICLAQGAPASQIGQIQQPAAGQVNITFGGNRNLDVERAKTYTLGFVFQPDFVPGFSATVDYFNIKLRGAITSPSEGDIIAACFGNISAGSATNPACTAIRRDPETGELSGAPDTTPGLPLLTSNLGRIETDGIDVALNYRRNLGFAGLNLSVLGTWTDEQKFQAAPGAINRECVGFFSVNCGSIQPEFVFNTRGTLTMGGTDLSLLWRYLHKTRFEPQQLREDIANAIAAGCEDPTGADPDGCVVNPEFRRIPTEHYFDFTCGRKFWRTSPLRSPRSTSSTTSRRWSVRTSVRRPSTAATSSRRASTRWVAGSPWERGSASNELAFLTSGAGRVARPFFCLLREAKCAMGLVLEREMQCGPFC